jgi:hypothetical protein
MPNITMIDAEMMAAEYARANAFNFAVMFILLLCPFLEI